MYIYLYIYIYIYGLHGLPPGCGWSVTDFWGWDAHEARLRCPDEVDGEYGVPGEALNLNSTNFPDHIYVYIYIYICVCVWMLYCKES
jgi:hypothetical protein